MVQKCPLFVNDHTIENVNTGGGRWLKKRQNFVNVVCERPQRRISDNKDPRTLGGQKILNDMLINSLVIIENTL